MDVSRPDFPAPVIVIDGFLSETVANIVLEDWLSLRLLYTHAKIFDGPSASRINRDFRTNDVVMLDDLFGSMPERSTTLSIIKGKVWSDECKALWHEGYSIFETINYASNHEAVVSRYGDGAFYRKHRDTRYDVLRKRLVTLVYYANRLPQRFSGGALTLWEDDASLRIEPKHDRAVIFPSFLFHEVEPVSMASKLWDDARFSLNYWIGFN
jgi:2OG-Fe(II) oxygenase superfamily